MSKFTSKLFVIFICIGMLCSLNYLDPYIGNTQDANEGMIVDKDTIGDFDNPKEEGLTTKDNYPPDLLSPSSGEYVRDTTPLFDWSSVPGANMYRIQCAGNPDFTSPYIDHELTNSYYIAPSALPQGIKYWRVKTRHQIIFNFWGDWSAYRTFTIDTIAPGRVYPTNPSNGEYIDSHTIAFTWSGVTDAYRYELQVDQTPDFSSPMISNTNIIGTGITYSISDGTYYFRVRARDIAGNTGLYSYTRQFIVDTTAPTAPVLTSPPDGWQTNHDDITLYWTPASGTNFHELYVAYDPGFTMLKTYAPTSATSLFLTNLADDTYYWRVRSRDLAGNWGPFAAYKAFTIDTTGPIAPVLESPTAGTLTNDDTPFLEWYPSATANYYEFQISDTDLFTTIEYSDSTANTYGSPTSLSNGQHYWRVRARDSLGNWGAFSSPWNFIVDTINPGIPTAISPVDGIVLSDSTPYFEWSTASDAVSYQLEVSTSPTFATYLTYQTTNIYYTLPTQADGQYYWRVRARDLAGNLGSPCVQRLLIIDTTTPSIIDVFTNPSTVDDTDSVTIYCNISDTNGIDVATLYYRVNAGSWSSMAMTWTNDNQYEATLGTFVYADVIEYYITAEDNANPTNIAINDNGGAYFSFTVNSSDNSGPTITNIGHSPSTPTDTDPVIISCDVEDLNGVHSVNLSYRVNSGAWVHIIMTFDATSISTYEIDIGTFTFDDVIEYYITAVDDYVLHNIAIENNSGAFYSITIGPSDVTGPTITDIEHSPTNPDDTDSITISCTVIDASGIDFVTLVYRIDGGDWLYVNMTLSSPDIYSYTIGIFTLDSLIEYYIVAFDDYVAPNVNTNDNGGLFYGILIVASDVDGPAITDIIQDPTTPTDEETITISCSVTDSNGVSSVTLYYRIDGGSWLSVSMNLATGSIYEVTIGAFAYDEFVEYYIVAIDNYVSQNEETDDNGGLYYNFTVGASDIEGPIITDITHTPINPEDTETVTISCSVNDQSGVLSVTLYYRINLGSWVTIVMANTHDDVYEVELTGLEYADTYQYYIVAVDDYPTHNSETDNNSSAFYSFLICSGDHTAPTITDVEQDITIPNEFDIIVINCTVEDAAGIANVTLYYRIDSGTWISTGMTHITGTLYEVTLGPFKFDELVEYYIVAVDASPNNNEAIEDNSGIYYNFTIICSDTTAPVIDDITHSPIAPHDLDAITISCIVTDSYGLHSVTLYYRTDGGAWQEVGMVITSGRYQAIIGTFAYGEVIEYYIIAIDDSPIQNEATDNNGGSYYNFTIASSDITGPTITDITHTPNPTNADEVNITCITTDSYGIQGVTLYYRIDGGAWIAISMNVFSGNLYGATIGPFNASSTIQYYIVATDNSPNHNPTTDDNLGLYYSFAVTAALTTNTSLYYIIPIIALFGLTVLRRKKN